MLTTTAQPSNDHTSLDPHVTSTHQPDDCPTTESASVPTAYGTWRHAGWQPQRTRTAKALAASVVSDRAAASYHDCGNHPTIHRHKTDPDDYVVRVHKCRSRWCVPCARERAWRISQALTKLIDGRVTRFVTLTLKTGDRTLAESIDHLTQSFTRLRRSHVWARSQSGGAAMFELRYNHDVKRWHPHLHVITEGGYMAKESVRDAWLKATGDSYIIDIGLVRSAKHLAHYVTSYASKPIDASVTRHHDLHVEAINALHGKRACATYGAWRGTVLLPKPDEDAYLWVANYDYVADLARKSPDGHAAKIMTILTNRRHDHEQDQTTRGPPTQDQGWRHPAKILADANVADLLLLQSCG